MMTPNTLMARECQYDVNGKSRLLQNSMIPFLNVYIWTYVNVGVPIWE